jgi:OmpA-OmpF porin, OOP family
MRILARTRARAATVAVSLLLLASSAVAGEAVGSTYVTAMAHGQWQDDARDVADDFVLGLAIGHVLGPRWNVELNVARGEFDAIDGNDLVINSAGVNFLRVFYRDSRVAPYLLLGAGWEEQNTELLSTEHDPYADIGVGMVATFGNPQGGRSFSLRGEIRGRHTFIGDDHRLVDYLAGVGFQFAFGGTRTAPSSTAPSDPQAATLDADADGIRDDTDKCLGTPPGARIDETGCERDSDKDSVLDSRDKCPGSRPNLVIDSSGCEADTDSDGVLESKDKCPGTPRGDRIDAAGCSLAVRLEILFENNSSQIRPESAAELERAASLLRAVPSITGVIEGHTDNVGSARHNLELSQRRAESVRDYLLEKGIDAARLEARGLGETQPIADNSTSEGRASNRRVVLSRTDSR